MEHALNGLVMKRALLTYMNSVLELIALLVLLLSIVYLIVYS